MNRVLLIGSQHGNETIGVRLYEYLKLKDPAIANEVEYYCANPLAFAVNKRLVDTDMNRSYALQTDGYEALQAKKLKEYIQSGSYDYIIDCHTTTTEVGACFIIKQRNTIVDRVINASQDMTDIIQIKEEIAATSLLAVSDSIVAIEVNETVSFKESTLDSLVQMVQHLVSGTSSNPIPRFTYAVQEFIAADDTKEGDQLRNFEEYQGRYPVLCGGDLKNRTYKGFWVEKQATQSI